MTAQMSVRCTGCLRLTHLHDTCVTAVALQLHVHLAIPSLDCIHDLPVVDGVPNVVAK